MATLLDPRFKQKFFESSMINCYKEWIINELIGMTEIAPNDELVFQSNENEDLFDSFLKVNETRIEREAPFEIRYLIEAVSFLFLLLNYE